MSFVFELLFELILEVAAYGVGRVFVMIFVPWCGVEPATRHHPQEEKRWKWRGMSYRESGKLYLRVETVQLIGLAIIVGAVVMVFALKG